jgi:hypothetical protein
MKKNGTRKKENKGGEKEMVTLTQEEKDFIDDLMEEAQEEDQEQEEE